MRIVALKPLLFGIAVFFVLTVVSALRSRSSASIVVAFCTFIDCAMIALLAAIMSEEA